MTQTEKRNRDEVTIQIGDQELEVSGFYSPEEAGTYDDPPIQADFEIQEIIWIKKNSEGIRLISIDITELIYDLDPQCKNCAYDIETEAIERMAE